MRKLLILIILFLSIKVIISCNPRKLNRSEANNDNQLETANDIGDFDKMFLAIASSAGIMEVELGKMAKEKATKTAIVAYGNMMVEEHTKINEDFKVLVKRLQIRVPDTMNEQHVQMVKEHAALSGKTFDEKYVQTMIDDHALATKMFKMALDSAKNEDYLNFLKPMIKIVSHHQQMAQKLQEEKK